VYAESEIREMIASLQREAARADGFKSQKARVRIQGWEHALQSEPRSYRLLHGGQIVSKGTYAINKAQQIGTPILLTTTNGGEQLWRYRDRFWWDSDQLEAEDVEALVLRSEKRKQSAKDLALAQARAEVFGEQSPSGRERRRPIPEAVRHEVWRRDQGQCVDCGSRENLEFDHIVPVSAGGPNTARNIDLRCESCNRMKGATI